MSCDACGQAGSPNRETEPRSPTGTFRLDCGSETRWCAECIAVAIRQAWLEHRARRALRHEQ